MPITGLLVPVLTLISAHSLFRMIGMPNSIHLICAFFLLCCVNVHFPKMCNSQVVYMIRICLASLFCYSLRVYLYSSIGFVFSDLVTVVIGASSVSGSGGKIIPHSSPATSSSEDSFGIQVLSEPWPVIHNETLESSMRNRIRVLENTDCIFLLDKEKGEYWAEVKRNLDSCPSQQEYNRVIEFESRDLQIRELRHKINVYQSFNSYCEIIQPWRIGPFTIRIQLLLIC